MSIWGDLLGGGIVSKGVDMLDDAVLTDQERMGFKAKLLTLYEPYKIAQRLLAFIVSIPFIGLHIVYSLVDLYLIAKGHDPVCEELAQRNINTLGEGWGWIMIWYFTGGVVEGGVKAAKGLFKAKNND
jgi:hypothetical protein